MPSLYLTKWDAPEPVYVPSGIVSNLKNHHISGIRFLFSCYHEKLQGAILNHDKDMNFPVQISAFLNALQKEISLEMPVLVVCPDNRVLKWLYHLSVYGNFEVFFTTENRLPDGFKIDHRIILLTFKQIKLVESLLETEFSFIIVEDLDTVSNKRIFKQLCGNFHIGLSTRNFLADPNQKIFFEMVNWTNPKVLGKYSEFCSNDFEHFQHLRWPYDKYWQRLTWNFCEKFKRPTDEEKEEYIEKMRNWAEQDNLNLEYFTVVKVTRKRKNQVPSLDFAATDSENSNDICVDTNEKSASDNKRMACNKHGKGKSSKNIKKNTDVLYYRRSGKRIETDSKNLESTLINIFNDKVLTASLLHTSNNKNSSAIKNKKETEESRNNNRIMDTEGGDSKTTSSENCKIKEDCSSNSLEIADNKVSVPDSNENLTESQEKNDDDPFKTSPRKRALPLLNSSEESVSDNDGSEDSNSILTSLITSTVKEENELKHEADNAKMSQAQLTLCTMLEQSYDDFEKSLDDDSDDYDILASIMKKDTSSSGKRGRFNNPNVNEGASNVPQKTGNCTTKDVATYNLTEGSEVGNINGNTNDDSDSESDSKNLKKHISNNCKVSKAQLREKVLSFLSEKLSNSETEAN